jgi:hypothetical protein
MLLKSQNGWPASSDRSVVNVKTVEIPVRGGIVKVPLRAEAAPRLTAMIQWWDQNVEPVYTSGGNAGTWGYAYRTIRGYTTTLSNHASGTAIDINAPLHPLGKRGTVPADKVAAIRAKAAALGLRWGGDYSGRADEMHFEINFAPPSEVTAYSEQRSRGIAAAAPEVAELALATAKGTAREIVGGGRKELARKLRRNWIIVGVAVAAILGIGSFALAATAKRRKSIPALPAPTRMAANPRRRRR